LKLQTVFISAAMAAVLCFQVSSQIIAADLPDRNPSGSEIWIAANPGVGRGKGTQSDPFDGSTAAKLDALLNSYYKSKTKNLHVHLSSGTFQTRISPENGWHPRSGWTIEGAGMDITTLQAAPANLAGVHCNLELIKGDFSSPINNVTIKELTLDCNWPALARNADAGVGAYTVTDARITNGSPILTSESANNSLGFDPSHFSRTVSGTGIPANATILRIPSTTITEASDGATLPQSNINVASTSDFASSGTILVIVDNGSAQTISYDGKTSTSFTGCAGGSGKISLNNSVTALNQIVMSANATATSSPVSVTIGGEKNVKVAGTALGGSNNRLIHVRCINAYGSFANAQEAFALGLTSFRVIGTQLDGSNDVIDSCVVERFLGNYGNPFYIAGDFSRGHPLRNSKVIHCIARGWNTGNKNIGFNSGGVNGAGLKDCEIADNTFIDCGHIFYQDTDPSENIRILNNTAIRSSGGVWLVADGGGRWTKKNITIAGNKISIQNRNGPYANVSILFEKAQSTNVRITNNSISYDGSGTGKNANVEVELSAVDGAELSNNRCSDNTTLTIHSDVLNFSQQNNRTFSGKPIEASKPNHLPQSNAPKEANDL
jgi:hypothetical protein